MRKLLVALTLLVATTAGISVSAYADDDGGFSTESVGGYNGWHVGMS